MKIALLGYGMEGQASERFFRSKYNADIDIFDKFTPEQAKLKDYSPYDLVMRSPSVPPLGLSNESSITKFFFDYCPCPIIGVTATKGKGTTCSFIKSLLDAEKKDAYLVGNIGLPSIELLDRLTPNSVVVYELSSFQLWDLYKSPHIAVVGQIEPDHLNVHKSYEEYLSAKANIARHQTPNDYLIYYADNPDTTKIASLSQARHVPYPFAIPEEIEEAISLPGEHNKNNALAAIAAVASYNNISPDDYVKGCPEEIITGLKNFKGLPHRLEFIGEHKKIKYYDDNFSTNPSSTRVAINAFPNDNLVIIVGGRDKTDNQDLPELYHILQSPQVKSIILIGESGRALMEQYQDPRYVLAGSLPEAVKLAREEAEAIKPAIVLMSPAAASFDMFKNVYDRGKQFKSLIAALDH